MIIHTHTSILSFFTANKFAVGTSSTVLSQVASVPFGEFLVIAGSGRTADILSDALRGEATDERTKKLAKSGILQYINLIDMEKGVKNLGKIIKDLLSYEE
jgi:hypothetical protein